MRQKIQSRRKTSKISLRVLNLPLIAYLKRTKTRFSEFGVTLHAAAARVK